MRYKEHKKNWVNCNLCELCKQRKTVVLARGKLPCAMLFIGEAPGASEDVLGQPFVGPAGLKLSQMIDQALEITDHHHKNPKIAFTNLVSCIPKDETGTNVKEPDKKHILACSKRLKEFVIMAKPKVIVCVGSLPEKWVPKLVIGKKLVNIMHPAAILKMDISQQGLAIQRTVIRLSDSIEEL